MRCLNKDAGAIAGIGFAAAGAPVRHVFQNGKRIGNNLVRFVAFDIGYKPDTACIPLKRRIVKTVVALHHNEIKKGCPSDFY